MTAQTQDLGGWTVTRNIDGDELIKYQLPLEFCVSARAKVKVTTTAR